MLGRMKQGWLWANSVTIRDRDSWKQVRSQIRDLPDLLFKYFQQKIDFEDLGVFVES